ncbi:MAG: branched-chain-amino-acid transaminase [Phycisphaeraceae bacterium]|nr:branched-chain-amino-acid transaminase [Phycisphaeraceae bacterium]
MTQTASGAKPAAVPAPPPAAKERPYVWVNGALVPASEAKVSVWDHGLLYGDGIFEGIRVYRGRIFLCGQHMDRLWWSAEQIRLKIHITREEMVRLMRTCIEANEITDGYIRLLVTRGVGTLGLNPFLCPEPGIVCIADQIRLFPKELYESGMKVVVAERFKTPVACLDPRIKSLNYLNNILAKVEAIDQGLLEVIMLNTDGKVTEGSGDNLFLVKGGQLFTPPLSVGALGGITRRFVMDRLAPSLGLKVQEKVFELSDIFGADEAFLTGSAAEIIGISGVIDRKSSGGKEFTLSGGKEGPTTNRLRQAFRAIVTSDNIPED